MLLPKIETRQDYRSVYRDANTWLPAMRMICQRHGLDSSQLELAPAGTHVVFKVWPDRYIKLFAPLWCGDFIPERLALQKLSGQPGWPVPRLLAQGEIESWPYIILSAVEGMPLGEVWDQMAFSDRERIAASCGEFLAALHAVFTNGLEEIAVNWPAFVEKQIQNYPQRLADDGLSEGWIHAIQEFFDDLPPLFKLGFQPVLLSADATDEHILVSERGGRWEMTGFIDFGDAMLGHPLYDFVAPGCCITRGSLALRRAMLRAYGFSDRQLDETLTEQLMAYTLLHRFAKLADILDLFKVQRPTNLNDLKRELWAFNH